MRIQIQPKASLEGTLAVFLEVSDHRVVNGNVDSQVAYYAADGRQLAAFRRQLAQEHYDAWTVENVEGAGKTDDQYFAECHLAQADCVAVPPPES